MRRKAEKITKIEDLVELAIDQLKEQDSLEEAQDLDFEIIDGVMPVYYAEYVELAQYDDLMHLPLGELGSTLSSESTVLDAMQAALFEEIREKVGERWDEVEDYYRGGGNEDEEVEFVGPHNFRPRGE